MKKKITFSWRKIIILDFQVEAAQREAEKQAKAISSNQMDSKNNPLNKELSDLKKNKSELERKLKSQSDELQNITVEVRHESQ